MKISIIVPVYNCEKYIENCIKKIINQTYKEWELILIDDGSKDESLSICRRYMNLDKRIKVLCQNNQGAGIARNNGIDASTGKYIMFCDADDFLVDNAIEVLVSVAEDKNTDLVISGYNEFKYNDNAEIVFCGENNADSIEFLSKEECRKNYITLRKKALIQAPWAKLYKASIVKENKVYFGDYRRCQDTVFNINYYDNIESITVIKDRLYNYLTPDGDVYISKYPVNMMNIRKEIDEIVTNFLKKWSVYNEATNQYLNSVLVTELLICCRLNFGNNWTRDKKEQKKYILELLNDNKIQEIVSNRSYGSIKNMLCLILKSRIYWLIKYANKIILFLKK